ncbi:hypothetical protein CLV58_12575 [Spirosoma oryzae]|uniref:Uncharacterized protein n=1 Tax=Spirosoma oryzae TaxID=1469603 RepID=A0A2T0S920_9BACT|nr:hypothetical protein [Spirosoma oryzae]PRY29813.1 hypothetical protein CLV58_12575 [Spirosoma oryzae]
MKPILILTLQIVLSFAATAQTKPVTTTAFRSYSIATGTRLNAMSDSLTKQRFDINANKTALAATVSGTAVQSADGITTSFSIAHGLPTTPVFAQVQAESDDADNTNILKVTKSSTTLTVFYKVAPPPGNNNLRWNWIARL